MSSRFKMTHADEQEHGIFQIYLPHRIYSFKSKTSLLWNSSLSSNNTVSCKQWLHNFVITYLYHLNIEVQMELVRTRGHLYNPGIISLSRLEFGLMSVEWNNYIKIQNHVKYRLEGKKYIFLILIAGQQRNLSRAALLANLTRIGLPGETYSRSQLVSSKHIQSCGYIQKISNCFVFPQQD